MDNLQISKLKLFPLKIFGGRNLLYNKSYSILYFYEFMSILQSESSSQLQINSSLIVAARYRQIVSKIWCQRTHEFLRC